MEAGEWPRKALRRWNRLDRWGGNPRLGWGPEGLCTGLEEGVSALLGWEAGRQLASLEQKVLVEKLEMRLEGWQRPESQGDGSGLEPRGYRGQLKRNE